MLAQLRQADGIRPTRWSVERAHDFPPYPAGGSLTLSVTARLLTMTAMVDCAPSHAEYRVDKALRCTLAVRCTINVWPKGSPVLLGNRASQGALRNARHGETASSIQCLLRSSCALATTSQRACAQRDSRPFRKDGTIIATQGHPCGSGRFKGGLGRA